MTPCYCDVKIPDPCSLDVFNTRERRCVSVAVTLYNLELFERIASSAKKNAGKRQYSWGHAILRHALKACIFL